MQKISRVRVVLAVAVTLGFGSASAYAQDMAGGVKPLVVIRFNQPRVYYDQQLYNAVSQAVAVKPGVVFDVVSNAPATGNADTDAQWVTTASQHTQGVVAAMQRIGVPVERMRVTGQTQAGLRYDETQVFVR